MRAALAAMSAHDLLRDDWPLPVPVAATRLREEQSASALAGMLGEEPGEVRVLDLVSPAGLARALEVAGILTHIEALGYRPHLKIEVGHPLGDRLHIADETGTILCDIRLRRARRPLPPILSDIEPPAVLDLLQVEWLGMQHPRGRFTSARPRLPGQDHPGLGLGRRVGALLHIAAGRMGADGVLNRPRHYHNAELYAAGFRYLDPGHEGSLVALRRDLGHLTLAARSWAFEEGRLRAAGSGEAVAFWRGEQVMPVSARLAAALEGRRYRDAVRAAAAAVRYRLDDGGRD